MASGCVADQSNPNPPPREQPIYVRYWAENPSKTEIDILATFQRTHPDITLVRVDKSWPNGSKDHWPFLAGEVDVVFLPPKVVGPLSKQGVLRQLPSSMMEIAERELRYSLLLDGRHYDFPLTVNPLAVFTWPDLISKAPELRWSWDQLRGIAEEAAQKRTADSNPLHGLAVHESAAVLLRTMVVQSAVSGGIIPIPKVLYLNMNADALAPGAELIHALFQGKANAYIPPHDSPDAALRLFAERKAAMLLADYETGLAFLQGVQGWTVNVTPKLDKSSMHVPVAEVTSVAVAAESKRPEQAIQLAAFLASEEAARLRAQSGALPVINSLQPDWLSYAGHLVSYPRDSVSEELQFAVELDQIAESLTRADSKPLLVMARMRALQKDLCSRWSGPERPQNCRH